MMVENLRKKLSEKPNLEEVTEALKTPFEMDAYDMGALWAVRYTPQAREKYFISGPSKDSTLKLGIDNRDSYADTVLIRRVQHSIPTQYNDVRKDLGKIADLLMSGDIRKVEEGMNENFKLFCSSPEKLAIMNEFAQKNVKDARTLVASMLKQHYENRELGKEDKFKPKYVTQGEWKEEIAPNGFHHFLNSWDQSFRPRFDWNRLKTWGSDDFNKRFHQKLRELRSENEKK